MAEGLLSLPNEPVTPTAAQPSWTPPAQSAPSTTPPMGFQDLYNLHQSFTSQHPEFKDLSLHDFSDMANRATGTQNFSQGLNDNWVRDLVAQKNNFIKPVTDIAGDLGASIGGLVGHPEAGRSAGAGIPETLADIGVVAAPTLLDPAGGEAASAAIAPFVFGGSGAINTYGETGSKAAALASGIGGAALPASGRISADIAGSTVNKYLGREAVNGLLPQISPTLARLADFVGANAGIVANQEATNVATAGAVQGLPGALDAAKHIFTVDNAVSQAIGLAPFAAHEGIAASRFGKPTADGEYSGTAQVYRDQENYSRLQALQDTVAERFKTTATTAQDIVKADDMPAPLTGTQVEQNLGLVPSGKKAIDSAQTLTRGLNDVVGSREGQPYKSAAGSAETIAEKLKYQDEPSETLFQKPIQTPAKSAEESAQVMQDALARQKQVAESQSYGENLKGDLQEQELGDPYSQAGIRQHELPNNFIQPEKPKEGDINEGQSKIGAASTQENGGAEVRGSQPDGGDAGKVQVQSGEGRTDDERERKVGGSDSSKGDENVPLTLSPEVVEMVHNKPETSEGVQKMMETNNALSQEALQLKVGQIKKGIQTMHEFEPDEMRPFTDKWISDHFNFNRDQGMSDKENYNDIVNKAQAHFRDTVNAVNTQLHAENDRRHQERENRAKNILKGKQTFEDRITSFGESLKELPQSEQDSISKDLTSVLKEKDSGQQTQGEANVYEAASTWLKNKKEGKAQGSFRGTIAKAYDLGTREEMRSKSSETEETEVNEKGETIKVKKMPLSMNAPIGEEGKAEFGDSLQEIHITHLPESQWVDEEAQKLQPSNPTAQEVQRTMIIKKVKDALELLKRGGNQQVLDAYRKAKFAQPRNPEAAIQRLYTLALADMTKLQDHELVGNVFKEDGSPLSEESIHGERAKARAVLAELVKSMMGPKGVEPSANKASAQVKAGDIAKVLDPENSIFKFSKNDPIPRMQEGTRFSFQQTSKEFFRQWARKSGMEGEESKIFTDTAERIALAMATNDKTRLGELADTDKNVFGAFQQVNKPDWKTAKNPYTAFIGLLKDPATLAKFRGVKDFNFLKFYQLWNLGHEAAHGYEREASQTLENSVAGETMSDQDKAFVKMKNFADTLSSQEKYSMILEMSQIMTPQVLWRNDQQVLDVLRSAANYGASSTEEFLAQVNGLIHIGMATSPEVKGMVGKFSEYLKYSSAAMQDFSRGIYLNLNKYSNAMEGYFRSLKTSLQAKAAGVDMGKIADMLHEAMTFQKTYGRIQEEVNEKIQELARLKVMQPANWLDHWGQNNLKYKYDYKTGAFNSPNGKSIQVGLVGAANSMGMTAKTPEELFKKNSGLWSLMTSGHWAQKFPMMADVMELAHSYNSIVNEYISRAVAPLMLKLDPSGKLVRDTSASGIKELVSNTKAHDAINKIFAWQNANDAKLAPEEIVKQFTSGLDAKSAKLVSFYRDAISRTMTDIATRAVAGKQSDMVNAAAFLILKDNPALDHKAYHMLAQDMVNAKLGMQSQDPQQQIAAQMKLSQIMQNATPGVLSASRLVDALVPQFQTFSKTFLDRPGYTPETRPGPYMVRWDELQEDGTTKPFVVGFKNKAEAAQKYNQMALKKASNLRVQDNTTNKFSTEGLNYKVVEAMTKFDRAAFQNAMNIAPDSAEEFSKYFQSGEGLLKEMQSRGYRKNLQPRKLVGGREDLDIFQECFNYIQSMSTGLAKNEVRGQLMLRSNEAKVIAEPHLRQEAVAHVENVINPPAAEFNKLKEGIFQYYLGGNISSIVVDMSHPFMALAPFLIEKGAGTVGAYKNLAYAGAKVMSTWAKGSLQKATTVEDFQKLVGDKDLALGLFKAKQERLLDHGILNEFRTSDDMDLLNLRATATDQGSLFGDVGSLMKNSAYQYLRLTRQLFSLQSKNNNLMTYIAAFKTAKDQGQNVDAAHDFATQAVNTVLPQGGRGSRPVAFAKAGKMQSVLGVMYALQSYTSGLLSMHARLAADSLGQSGLTGVQLTNARKALATAVISQVALSGILGLPFVGAVLAELQNIFPELKASQTLRETFHLLGGGDQQMGDAIADGALKGLPAMIAGVDLSGRLGLGNILGTNPYNGFDASALLGPTGSLVQKMVLGMGDAVQGNTQGAAENLLPIAYKNLLDAYAFDKVGRDKDGNMLEQPSDATKFLSAVGLKTTKETDARDEQGMLRQSQRANAAELKGFLGQVADHIATGDMDGARTLLYQRSQQDPSFSAQAGVKAAVQVLQDRQAPRDMLARVGVTNSEDAQHIAALFPPVPEQGHAVQDELQKSMLERQVGVPGVGMTPQAKMKEAQAVDYLVDAYRITPSQARAMLSHSIEARQKFGQRQQAWESGVVPASQ